MFAQQKSLDNKKGFFDQSSLFSGGNVNNTTQIDSNVNESTFLWGERQQIMNEPIENLISNLGVKVEYDKPHTAVGGTRKRMSRFEQNFQNASFGRKPDRIQSGKVTLDVAFKN